MIDGELKILTKLSVDIDCPQVTRKANDYVDHFALMFDADAIEVRNIRRLHWLGEGLRSRRQVKTGEFLCR